MAFNLTLPYLVPGRNFSYSDREAVSSLPRLKSSNSYSRNMDSPTRKKHAGVGGKEFIDEAKIICNEVLASLQRSRIIYGIGANRYKSQFEALKIYRASIDRRHGGVRHEIGRGIRLGV